MMADVPERNENTAIMNQTVAVTTRSLHDTSIAKIQSDIGEIAVDQNLRMMNLASEEVANDMSSIDVDVVSVGIRRANGTKVEKAAMNASDGEMGIDKMVENDHASSEAIVISLKAHIIDSLLQRQI